MSVDKPKLAARELDELLEKLESVAAETATPHQEALALLGLNQGRAERSYDDKAFDIWTAQIKKHPDDVETLHHLAIMHHSRAMAREEGRSPRDADSDWQAAMNYWSRLLESEPFWVDYIAKKACVDDDFKPMERLRAELPAILLRIHYDPGHSLRKEIPAAVPSQANRRGPHFRRK